MFILFIIPLREYTKFELRCLLTDPAVNLSRLPSDFKPMTANRFRAMVEPIFADEEWQKELGQRITLHRYKEMRTLPLKLVKVILKDAGLSYGE